MATSPTDCCRALPYPLGATWDGLGINFAVFSAQCRNASSSACSIRPAGARSRASRCPNAPTRSGTATCPSARPGLIYGYRAHGPYEPQRGHRFNPHKLLLDPYARRIVGRHPLLRRDVRLSRELAARRPLARPPRQRARRHAKGVVLSDDFNWGDDRPPNVPWSDTVIYEAHLKGLTHLRPDAAAARARHLRRAGRSRRDRSPAAARRHRGRAAADPCLRAGPPPARAGPAQLLGLQHARASSRSSRATSSTARLDDMRIAVRRLHAAGIEVILDVVYNHTAEGNEFGPTLSLPRPRQRQLLPARCPTIRATTSTTPAPATR